MSEKFYAFLLLLYPAHFRKTFGDAALQLFRDRCHHERGLRARVRLWLDLLADFAVSVPREYCRLQAVMVGATEKRLDGQPSFQFLEPEAPRPGALLCGVGLSLVAVFAFLIAVGHAKSDIVRHPSAQQTRGHAAPAMAFMQHSRVATHFAARDSKPHGARSLPMLFLTAFAPQQPPERPQDTPLDAAGRQRTIHAVIANLKQYYIDPDVSQKMAAALLAHEKGHDYDAVTDGKAFADLLTSHIREVSEDRHLIVEYRKEPLPDRPPGPPPPGAMERYRSVMEQENCTFEKIEILEHNIGYLKLNSFPEPSVCRQTATAAMASLDRADAIIFDLRDNRGGYPEMVALLAAYLFDHPEYLYNPRKGVTEQSWTESPVPGSKLADKPVFVLTSAKTVSGAEQFSYDLKMLKRATLVGETTRGSAHSGRFHRIDDHFGMGIPEVRAINPFSKTDWEGTGVEPDVKVQAGDALVTAQRLAESKLRKK